MVRESCGGLVAGGAIALEVLIAGLQCEDHARYMTRGRLSGSELGEGARHVLATVVR